MKVIIILLAFVLRASATISMVGSPATGGNYAAGPQTSITTSSFNATSSNAIVCGLGMSISGGNPPFSITDAAGNVLLPIVSNTKSGTVAFIYVALGIIGMSGDTVTATVPSGINAMQTSFICVQYSGIVAVDIGQFFSQASASTSATPPTFSSYEPNTLAVLFGQVGGSVGVTSASWSGPSGWTFEAEAAPGATGCSGSSKCSGAFWDKTFTSIQTNTSIGTVSWSSCCSNSASFAVAVFSDGTGCVTDTTHKGTCWPSVTVNVGDSLTYGGGVSDYTKVWAYLPLRGGSPVLTFGPSIVDAIYGTGGQTCLQMQTANIAAIDAFYNSSRKFNVLSFQCGINDAANNPSITAATVWGYMQTFINARIAVGWTVVVSTVTSNHYTEVSDPIQSALNGLIKSNATTLCGLNNCSANGGGMNYIASDMTADAGIGCAGCYNYVSGTNDGSSCGTPNPSTGTCPFYNDPHENNVGNATWSQYYYRALVNIGLSSGQSSVLSGAASLFGKASIQ